MTNRSGPENLFVPSAYWGPQSVDFVCDDPVKVEHLAAGASTLLPYKGGGHSGCDGWFEINWYWVETLQEWGALYAFERISSTQGRFYVRIEVFDQIETMITCLREGRNET